LTLYLVVLASVLTSIAQRGSKVTLSLYALDLGAGSFAVGLLGALYASFPLILAVHAGRISDRFGVRYPMLLGGVTMALSLVMLVFLPSLNSLYFSAALLGLGHIFFHVSVHNLVGSLGSADRTKNFATFSLGSSIAAFIGPSLAGFQHRVRGIRPRPASSRRLGRVAGGRDAPLQSASRERRVRGADEECLRSAGHPGPAPHAHHERRCADRHRALLVLPADLRRSIGLAPRSSDGALVLRRGGFMVRSFMHRLALRYTEIGVLTASLFLAGGAYALLPALHEAMFLGMAAFALGLALGSAQPLTIILTYNHAPKGRSARRSACASWRTR
jgi:MFS family permease